jgi:hypothetical protein
MLVNARSEFIWVLNLVIIRCVYSIILLYLYYQLFIHQNYTICSYPKTWYFLIWGPYRIQPFGKPNVRFGIGRSDMRHRFYFFVKSSDTSFRVLLLNYLFIICERNRRNVWTAQSIADNPPIKKEKGMPCISASLLHPTPPTPRLFMCVL